MIFDKLYIKIFELFNDKNIELIGDPTSNLKKQ